jgi:hypothetical protein
LDCIILVINTGEVKLSANKRWLRRDFTSVTTASLVNHRYYLLLSHINDQIGKGAGVQKQGGGFRIPPAKRRGFQNN